MPMLIMHGGRPPVAVANKTPMAQSSASKTPAVNGGKEDALTEILKKLTAIESELGITPPQEQQLSEEEIVRRELFVEKMQKARALKREQTEQLLAEEAKKKAEFVKRMAKARKKAAKARR